MGHRRLGPWTQGGTIYGDLVMSGANIDLDGNSLILDEDGDTSIASATDDTLTVTTGGTERLRQTNTAFSWQNGNAAIVATSSQFVINNTGEFALQEQVSAPSGAAGYAKLYAIDDGGSKTDVLAIFQTGSGVKFVEEV